ncbi:MAG: hypothetical protein U0736_09555 [Gemmataceae bacterium]
MDHEAEPMDDTVPRSRKPYFTVLMSGLLTSAATLAGVYWLSKNTDEFHIMGWYANYVIPAGAMIVGIAAASGYGLASWLTGTRISRGLLLAVLILQSGAYVTAEYVEYSDVMEGLRQRGAFRGGPEPTFAQYYDFKARSFTWKEKGPKNQPNQPLGGWGYVFVLLGAAGFVLSGLIAPAVLYSVPYCERCQRYMKTKLIGVLPASVPEKKIAKRDQAGQEAHAKEQEQAAAKAEEAVVRLHAAIAEGRPDVVQQELRAAGTIKANGKLPKRVHVSLVWCKSCQEGQILLAHASGQGQNLQQVPMGQFPVSAPFVGELLGRPVTSEDADQDLPEA